MVIYKEREVKFLSGGIYALYEKFGGMGLPIFRKEIIETKHEDYYHNSSREYTYYVGHGSKFSFTPYEKCNIEEKQACKEVEAKLENIKNSSEEKYDEPREISLYIAKNKDGQYFGETINLSVTERELANAGILPEEIEKNRTIDKQGKVSGKRIGKLDQVSKITERELAPIKRKGFKEWIKGLGYKLIGKGEK